MSAQILAAAVIAIALLWMLSRRRGERVSMPGGSNLPPGSVHEALAQGRKIEAIKLYRQQHGVGLREAKDAVEELARSLAIRSGS